MRFPHVQRFLSSSLYPFPLSMSNSKGESVLILRRHPRLVGTAARLVRGFSRVPLSVRPPAPRPTAPAPPPATRAVTAYASP